MMHRTKWTSKLFRAQLLVLYFFMYSLFLKVCRPLLHHWTTITKLFFYWVTVQMAGVFMLWHYGKNMLNAVLSILLRKIWREVLFPVVQILRHYQAVVQNICFYLACALPFCTDRGVLELLLLLKKITSPGISSMVHQSHHSETSFLQGNNNPPQTTLRLVVQRVIILVFLGVFDGVQEVFRLSIVAAKYELTQLLSHVGSPHHFACRENISDDITSILPFTSTPLCNRFKGPATVIFSDLPPTIAVLKFDVDPNHMIRGPGKYGLDATDIPLHARFQNNIRKKNVSSIKGTHATVKQVKMACVVFIVFYLSMLSIVIMAIK